ncbi:hypothetical protein ELC62_29120, partial [Klebsiella pneumoniae]|nr:hypothetical protein [Klebsiella pneumoniae]
VKVPQPKDYMSLKDKMEVPYTDHPIEPIDLSKFGRNELLHCAFMAVHDFYKEKKALPELNKKEDADKVVELAKKIYDDAKEKKVKWIENSQE